MFVVAVLLLLCFEQFGAGCSVYVLLWLLWLFWVVVVVFAVVVVVVGVVAVVVVVAAVVVAAVVLCCCLLIEALYLLFGWLVKLFVRCLVRLIVCCLC